MSTVARKVLTDCKNAHTFLEEETDATRFRILWVAGVALLRTVGHVLHKVDSTRGPALKTAIDHAYQDWKRNTEANAVFWDFIEQERNNLLKEYRIGFLSGPVDVVVQPDGAVFSLGENLFCPIADGRYAGEDCRDVLAEGIAWWERQLDAIEAKANS
jgi:hypothetical protein